ncbi:Trehalose-6-P synthase/phosphatase complex synthase subunit [Aspergillus fumigatus]
MSHKLSSQWYGWPGIEISEGDKKDVKDKLWRDHHAVPVWLSGNLADSHYNGFSNTVLWPLLHYHPGEFSFDKGHWKSYQEVNKIFAQLIVQDLRDGDIIWIHDYHLMLLPSLLRTEAAKRGKHVKIGFFLHTPFPSSQIYRILPVRKDILLGVLGSDLVGFHTYDYAKHFLRSCCKILDIPATLDGIKVSGPGDRVTRVRAFPIGIDPERFSTSLGTEKVRNRIHHLREKFCGRKILVGIDRLDYVKGIPQKLHAFESFLQNHPEWVGRAVFVQLAIPTRPDVEDYQCLRSSVNEQVGRVNGRFGTVEYVPVHFIHGTLPFDELLALYAVSDVCVVTSTRDGMNLVALEYIASHSRHSKDTGALILSEFAGAAQSLPGSITINPWDPGQIEDAYETSLCMGSEERWTRFQHLQNYVSQFTSSRWCQSFLEELNVG